MNGYLELTTNNSVFPYLWKGESESQGPQKTSLVRGRAIGGNTVCQWEFVSTKRDEIIYERALDHTGRMVYGFVYSPPGSGSPSTRLARFVGPGGFPQFQRGSVAEYVQIHYDGMGWADRVMYHDGKGLAAVGPDGAFGQSIQHDNQWPTHLCPLAGRDGRAMKDNAGNSGMQSKYNKNGYDIEDRSVGSRLETDAR